MMRTLLDRGTRMLALLCVASFAQLAQPAGATPVDLFYNGSGCPACYGFSATTAAAFQAAGGQVVTNVPVYADPSHTIATVATAIVPVSATIPSGTISNANPVMATNTWGVTSLSSQTDFWIVFRGHDPSDPAGYGTGHVGLNVDPAVDPWVMIQPDPNNFPDVFYLAYRFGATQAGVQNLMPIAHRLGQSPVIPAGASDYALPLHIVGFAFFAVPEPATAALLVVFGAACLVGRRRR